METSQLAGRSRGRRAALALLVATVAAAAVAAYVGWGYLVDSWWMWRLGSADRTTRNLAAEKLAERKCIRAVPGIMSLVAEDPKEKTSTTVHLSDDRSPFEYRRGTPLVVALWDMGEEALPAIEKASRDLMADGRIRKIVDELRDRRITIEKWSFAIYLDKAREWGKPLPSQVTAPAQEFDGQERGPGDGSR